MHFHASINVASNFVFATYGLTKNFIYLITCAVTQTRETELTGKIFMQNKLNEGGLFVLLLLFYKLIGFFECSTQVFSPQALDALC